MGSPGVGGTISAASDVNFSNIQEGQYLRRTGGMWSNSNGPSTGGAITLADIPAGSTITVAKSGTSWPARPTSRADVIVQWKGPDPSPAIVSSGTGGMLDNVDIRFITP